MLLVRYQNSLLTGIWFSPGYNTLSAGAEAPGAELRARVETAPAALFVSHPCEYINF